MAEWDAGPHREMAVDVPDSFVGRTKTPPRYPPPKSTPAPAPLAGSVAGAGATASAVTATVVAVVNNNVPAGAPVSPGGSKKKFLFFFSCREQFLLLRNALHFEKKMICQHLEQSLIPMATCLTVVCFVCLFFGYFRVDQVCGRRRRWPPPPAAALPNRCRRRATTCASKRTDASSTAPPHLRCLTEFPFSFFLFFFTEFFLLGNPIFIVRQSYRVLPVLASYRFALPSFVTEFFVTRHRSPFPGPQVLAWCRCCLTEFRLPSLPLSASRFDNEADLSCSVGLSCLELEIKIPSRRCQHVELNLKPSGLRVTELLPSKLPRPLVSYYRVGGANIYGGSWFLVVADAGAGERSAAHQSGRRRNRHAQRPTTRTDTQISGPCRLV